MACFRKMTLATALIVLLCGGRCWGQTAFYTLEGNFGAAGDQHDFHFNLSRDVSDSDELLFETHANNGGTNAAGVPVFSGGIDSVLELFDSSNASRGINDNFNTINPIDADSLLTWPGVVPPGLPNSIPLNPDPLPSGDYRLNLAEAGNDSSANWAVDLVGPANAMAFTGATPTSTSVVGTLRFGTSGDATDPAAFNQAGGSFNAVSSLFPAWSGQATMSVTAGGQVNSNSLFLAGDAAATGLVTVSGKDGATTASQLSTTNFLTIGDYGNGTLIVESGGRATSLTGTVGNFSGSVGWATVRGAGSVWNNTGGMFVGNAAQGTLNIDDGGQLNSATTTIGNFTGGDGLITIDGPTSTWVNTGNLTIGNLGVGELSITGGTATVNGTTTTNSTGTLNLGLTGTGTFNANGDVIVDGGTINGGAQGEFRLGGGHTLTATNNAQLLLRGRVTASEATINVESGSNLVVDDFGTANSDTVRNAITGTLNIRTGGQVSVTSPHTIGRNDQTGLVLVSGVDASGNPSRFISPFELAIGASPATGTLRVEAGGLVTSNSGTLSSLFTSQSKGDVIVTGTDATGANRSTWAMEGDFSVGGDRGGGSITIEAGGLITNQDGAINGGIGNLNSVTVTGFSVSGDSSTWINRGSLSLQDFVSGGSSLSVSAGGKVSSASGSIGVVETGEQIGNDGAIVGVTGSGGGNSSTWEVAGNLNIGNFVDRDGSYGSGTLGIADGALVTVGGVTDIGPGGMLNLDGGRFEFGRMSFDDYTAMNAVSGALAGAVDDVVLTGSNNVSRVSIGLPNGNFPPEVDVSEVVASSYTNQGLLFGSGILNVGLFNDTTGEIEVITGERMLLNDSASNAGQVTLAGGHVHSPQGFTNQAGGLVLGNGVLRADIGITNNGTMAFTSSQNVLANVIGDVTNNATGVISSSGGTLTFFDDVVNHGEIRTNAGSFTVYFGSYSGNGDTGTGTVLIEGDLKPGSSPGLMSFGGHLSVGESASLEIEIGGLAAGTEYDQVAVADELSLQGNLAVSLINGFTPSPGDSFTLVTATSISGTFSSSTLPSAGFELVYLPTSVELIAISALPGDYNNDGTVDLADYTVWRNNLGAPAGALRNDAIGGTIDADQYLSWKANYGATLPPAIGGSASVPEPTTSVLVILAATALAIRRRG